MCPRHSIASTIMLNTFILTTDERTVRMCLYSKKTKANLKIEKTREEIEIKLNLSS